MKRFIVLISLLALSLEVSAQIKTKNVLFLIVDDLRPELNSFGADYIYSPNIDELAARSRVFVNQYVNSPSCGPSRYTL